ncbi:hypothetical protein GGR54DRAFT_63691 [Hypoxylon sp. NC1633]|nr:hypothetical protein GGR54DRAFT_63691 [Hypoxylon sp. NC1633]
MPGAPTVAAKRKQDADQSNIVAVPLLHCPAQSRIGFDVYERTPLWSPFFIPTNLCCEAKLERVYLKQSRNRNTLPRWFTHPTNPELLGNARLVIKKHALDNNGFSLMSVYPPQHVELAGNNIMVYPNTPAFMCLFIFTGPGHLSIGLLVKMRVQHEPERPTHELMKVAIGKIDIADIFRILPVNPSRRGGWLDEVEKRLKGMQNPGCQTFEAQHRSCSTVSVYNIEKQIYEDKPT